MSELTKHIEALNAKTQAWLDEVPGRGAGMLVTDVAFWAERGVFTVEDFERRMLIANIWDAYKEINGIRPRFMDFDNMSISDLEETYERLWGATAQEEAAIDAICEESGISRETYDRWMTDVDKFYGEREYQDGLCA
jgi:hypothetical protein